MIILGIFVVAVVLVTAFNVGREYERLHRERARQAMKDERARQAMKDAMTVIDPTETPLVQMVYTGDTGGKNLHDWINDELTPEEREH